MAAVPEWWSGHLAVIRRGAMGSTRLWAWAGWAPWDQTFFFLDPFGPDTFREFGLKSEVGRFKGAIVWVGGLCNNFAEDPCGRPVCDCL